MSRVVWSRHDLGVLAVALAIFIGGALAHRSLSTPRLISFARDGLRFDRPGGWLSVPGASQATPLVYGFDTRHNDSLSTVHTTYVSPAEPRQRIELRIEKRPTYSNLRGSLAVQRLGQYGEFYWGRSSGNAAIDGHDWLRTEFRYAFKSNKNASPQVAEAVEYALVNDGRLYVVTLHDTPENLQRLDSLISASLRVSSSQNNSEFMEEKQ